MKLLTCSARTTSIVKTAAASTVAVAAMGSLTACGSKGEDAAVVSATATVTNTHKVAADGSDAADSSDEPTPADGSNAPHVEANGAGAAPAGGDAGAQLEEPFDDPNFDAPTNEPLANGVAGSEEDRRQMQETMYASLNPPSPEEWTRVLLDNSCSKVTGPFRARMQSDGYSLEQIEEAARMQAEAGQGMELPKSDVNLSDIRVDGTRASATAQVSNASGSETQTVIFENEDGRWKLCN